MNYDDEYTDQLGWWWIDQSQDQVDWIMLVDDISRTHDMDWGYMTFNKYCKCHRIKINWYFHTNGI